MNHRGSVRIVLACLFLISSILACEAPSQEVASDVNSIATQTMRALATTVAGALEEGTGGQEQGDEESPPDEAAAPPAEPSPTPTVTLTPTPAPPMVSVSMDTNCRFGPGDVYDYLGALMVGETSEVVAKNSSETFWYIRNPDPPPAFCWVWGFYASIEGDTGPLPVYTPPPTPTPSPIPLNFSVAADTTTSCVMGNWGVYLLIHNTGPQALESVEASVKDFDLGETQTQTMDNFIVTADCLTGLVMKLDPGASAYLFVDGFSADPAGHNLHIKTKLCTANGLGGNCVQKTVDDVVSFPSDVHLKTGIEPVDGEEVLEKLLELPITTWTYEWEDDGVRHMGPMAQDFYKAFSLGDDDRYINAVDSNGVAFAAIQAVYQKLQERDAQMEALADRLEDLESQITNAEGKATNLNLPVAGLSFLCGMLVGGFILSTYWRKKRSN